MGSEKLMGGRSANASHQIRGEVNGAFSRVRGASNPPYETKTNVIASGYNFMESYRRKTICNLQNGRIPPTLRGLDEGVCGRGLGFFAIGFEAL